MTGTSKSSAASHSVRFDDPSPHGSPWFSKLRSKQPGFAREPRLHQHLVAAHVDDGVDVLDVDGALLDAAAARRARPEHVGVDRRGHQRRDVAVALAAEQPVGRGEHVVAQAHDQELRTERLARRPRGTDALAAPALGAGREVEHLLPGEVLDLAGAEDRVLGDVLHVHVGGLVKTAERTGST